METITSARELASVLERLPPPPDGRVRVFRGQSRLHDRLVPAGQRHGAHAIDTWSLVSRIEQASLQNRRLSREVSHADIDDFGVWLPAIAQHYGPGSDYLDVTFDLNVAIWFALHSLHRTEERFLIRPPSTALLDNSAEVELYSYTASDTGWLYALDLRLWDTQFLPRSAELVDLRQLPDSFPTSSRIHAQQAGLARAGDSDDGALDAQVVQGTPVPIARSVQGKSSRLRSCDLFPPPSRDPWYAHFLNVPMTFSHGVSTPQATMRPSIPLWHVVDEEDTDYLTDLASRFFMVAPPMVNRAMPLRRPRFRLRRAWWQQSKPGDALIVQLQAPYLLTSEPATSGQWNHGLLVTDQMDPIPTYDLEHNDIGRVSTQSTWFEFSPLETGSWFDLASEGKRIRLPRAIWIQRKPGECAVMAFVQNLPDGQVEELTPPLLVGFNAEMGCLQWRSPGGVWRPWAEVPEAGKFFMVAFQLLRDLSPTVKPACTPRMTGREENGNRYLVPVSGGRAGLIWVEDRLGRHFYRLLDRSNQPFTRPRELHGVIEVQTSKEFCDLPSDRLRAEAQRIATLPADQRKSVLVLD